MRCLGCRHYQPQLRLTLYEEGGRPVGPIEAIEDCWERMVLGTPWVASCALLESPVWRPVTFGLSMSEFAALNARR